MGMERSNSKPSRSDELLTAEEQAQVEAATREFFDSAAPKRPPKPPRSEPGDGSEAWSYGKNDPIPEELRLRQLAARSQRLATEGGVVSCDEYHENEYYTGLISVDSQHYTTGAGYIKIEQSGSGLLHFPNGAVSVSGYQMRHKTNPATNEWEPSPDVAVPVSRKPPRSDP